MSVKGKIGRTKKRCSVDKCKKLVISNNFEVCKFHICRCEDGICFIHGQITKDKEVKK